MENDCYVIRRYESARSVRFTRRLLHSISVNMRAS